jgi:predicted DNA-binding transcriptional regulator YafY
MNAAERRNEIISILIVRHHATTKELASEFDVTVGTIKATFRLYLLRIQFIQNRVLQVGFL